MQWATTAPACGQSAVSFWVLWQAGIAKELWLSLLIVCTVFGKRAAKADAPIFDSKAREVRPVKHAGLGTELFS